MKGLIGIILIAVILYLISVGIITYTFSTSSVSLTISAKETKILRSIDYLEAIKDQLPCLVSETFNKTIVLLAKNGGYLSIPNNIPQKTNGPYWRVYDKVYVPNYKDNLIKGIGGSLSNYLSLSNKLGVRFTGPMKITLNENTFRSIRRLNFSDGKLVLKSDFYTISDKTNVSIPIDYSMIILFNYTNNSIIKGDRIKLVLKNSIRDGVSDECKNHYIGDTCEQNINPEEWYSSHCSDAVQSLENYAKNKVRNIFNKHFSAGTIEVKILKMKGKRTISYTYSEYYDDYDECGCKKWDRPTDTIYKGKDDEECKNYCESNGYDDGYLNETTGNCTCRSCILPYKMYKEVRYKANYYLATSLLLNLTTYYNIAFLENGKTVDRRISSIIYVNTSSDYNYRPL